jgi:hypothetical protein
LNRDAGYTILDFEYFRINLGQGLGDGVINVVALVFFLPGVVVHELGHLLGMAVCVLLDRIGGIRSLKPSYWGAPVSNLVVAGVLSLIGALTGSVVMAYVGMINAFCGTVMSEHDWYFEEGYSEEDKQENWNRLFGENQRV